MIDCRDLRFSYPGDSFELHISDWSVRKGESVALIGPSGCGKTTLLNLIAGVLEPDEGTVRIGEQDFSSLSEKERQAFRLTKIGMVPQNFELLDYLTMEENILVPIRLAGDGSVREEQVTRAKGLAERTGILELLGKFPSQLSQGERQRAAMCRGLITSPELVLADEPTGNLDPDNQDRIVSLLLEEAARIEATVLMITHEPSLEERFDRVANVLDLRKEAER